MSQREPQPPQADPVEAAERPGEHADRELGRERFAPEHERGRREQRGRCRCVAQRGARGVARGGHVGERESPLEGRHVGARAHDDGHRRPRHAVEQVPLAQEPGDRLALRRVRRRLDAQQRRERVGIGPGTADRAAVGGRQRRRPVRAAERGADVRRDRSDHVADGRAPAMHGVEHARGAPGRRRAPTVSEPSSSGRPPRNPLLATSGSPNATIATPRAANAPSRAAVASVASCASSTTRSRSPARVPRAADAAGSPVLRRTIAAANAASSAESNCVGRSCSLTSAYSARKLGRGDPLGARRTLAETRERGGVDAVLDRTHQEVAQLGAEAAQRAHLGRERIGPGRAEAVVDAALEELADDLVVLGAREQGDRLAGERAHELECQRVGRARDRTARRDPEPHGELVAQRGGRGSRGGQHEHLVGGVAEPFDPVGDELDDEPGLAAARSPEDRRVLAVDERRDGVQECRGAGHA